MTDGAFLGLVAGLGLLSIWWSLWEQEGAVPRPGRLSRGMDRLRDDLIKVGLDSVPPAAVPALSAGLGLVVAAALMALASLLGLERNGAEVDVGGTLVRFVDGGPEGRPELHGERFA